MLKGLVKNTSYNLEGKGMKNNMTSLNNHIVVLGERRGMNSIKLLFICVDVQL